MGKGNPPPYSPSAPPPPGFVMPGPEGYQQAQAYEPPHPNKGTSVVQVAPVQQPATVLVYPGNCPRCHIGNLRKEYITGCGIFWTIVLFPVGALCLLLCAKRNCTHCDYSK